MNILFVSYGVYEYDGRLRELIKIAKQIGNTTYITRIHSKNSKQENSHVAINIRGLLSYLKFIFKIMTVAYNLNNIDVLFIDNRKAVIPGLIVKIFKNPRVTIQDVRELYLMNEVNYLTGKIGCFVEKYLIERADILICANEYRSKIMQKYYLLSEIPLVYKNIRKLEFDNDYSMKELESRFNAILKYDTFRIISTSGYDIKRTNDRLVLAMKDLGKKFELLLVGGGIKEDRKRITELIQKNKIENVHIIDKLGVNELKYLIQQCQVGVVNYSKKDTNNKFCASGKIYEFVFEGLPVITTENLPLVDLVKRHHIGVSSDNYYNGIITIYKDYLYYKENVLSFAKSIGVDINNQQLVKSIKDRIHQIMVNHS